MDHRAPGVARRYHETFQEAYYTFDRNGNVDVVLRRRVERNKDGRAPITQIVHIRSIWRAIPGRTVAHESQINGTIRYHVVVGRTGGTFAGAGSMFFDENRERGLLTGSIELATLKPTVELASGQSLFERAQLSGSFRATHDPRRAILLINEMNKRFAMAN